MVVSVYPNGIPVFDDRRDLLDDVKASHINYIQRELTSITEVVGVNPHIYGDVTSSIEYVNGEPAGDGVLNAAMIGRAPFTPVVGTRNYGTVSERLDSIQQGLDLHVFSITGGGMSLSPSPNINYSNDLVGIQLPNQGVDPFGLYNGFGVTIKKSGWYYVQGQVVMDLENIQRNRDGAYAAAVNVNGSNRYAYDRTRLADAQFGGNPGSIILQPAFNGPLSAGSTLHIRVAHDSGGTHRIQYVYLNGFLVREL